MFPQDTHILVVDDSFNIRRIIVDTLKKMGYQNIISLDNATDAYKKMEELHGSKSPITLVLSDLNMPVMNGLDFLKKVRAQEKYKDLPFVLITTESEKGAVIEAATNGVSSYVVKPFNLETLTQRLRETWAKHNG